MTYNKCLKNQCPVEFNVTNSTQRQSTAITLANRIKRFGGRMDLVTRTDINSLGNGQGSSMASVRMPPRNF